MNKFLTGLIIVIIAVGGYFYFKSRNNSSIKSSNNPPAAANQSTPNGSQTQTPVSSSKPVATIETNLGSFQVTLEPDSAPKTVTNFIKLANEKYCEGTKFHRIVRDFVIQGCDPNSRGSDPTTYGQGGPGYTVVAELGLKAKVGAIGMASTQAKGPSSGSQFFIVTTDSADSHAALDGNYTIFGYVTSGLDIVTKIAAVPTEPNPVTGEASSPLTPVIINKITIKQ